MTQTSEMSAENQQASIEELAEVILELEQYRERLLNETLEAAQKAKMMKSKVMAELEPELNKIDVMIDSLKQQKAQLETQN
jgi:regulator of replication initiation timing